MGVARISAQAAVVLHPSEGMGGTMAAMSRPSELPLELLDGPFHIHDASPLLVPYSRLRRRDLARPFAGVRTANPLRTDRRGRCHAYAVKMAARELFSHATAALLWGIPLPLALEADPTLHVSVILPGRAPRDAGVHGHHLVDRPGLRILLDGLPVANPVETWCQLGTVLQFPDLVAAGDALVAKGRPNIRSTLARMGTAMADERPCGARLREALTAVRPGTRSRQETLLRLEVIRSGLPEPLVNAPLCDDRGEVLAEGDLVFPGLRTLLEYEGDLHRLDRRTFRRDITRREMLLDSGWHTIRITAADMEASAVLGTVARIRRRLLAQAIALDLPLSAVLGSGQAAGSGKSRGRREP